MNRSIINKINFRRLLTIKGLQIAIICLLFLLPFIQKTTHLFYERDLKGYYKKYENPDLTWENWKSDEFQSGIENYLKTNIGFHPSLIRVNSQLQYSLFRKAKGATIILGKKQHFYALQYINSYLGIDLVPSDTVINKVSKIREVSQKLAQKDIDLFIVIAPGKGVLMPEYIPDSYLERKQEGTNYENYIKAFKENEIKTIDFVSYFKQIKDTSRFELFSKAGIHWSMYGSYLACDSILNYIKETKDVELPDLKTVEIKESRFPNFNDRDITDGINLIFSIKQKGLAYPKVKIDSTIHKPELDVLIVGDSFYWQIIYHLFEYNFENQNFWFYYNEVFPTGGKKPLNAKDLVLIEEVEKRDVIMLVTSETKLKDLAWGFIDDLYLELVNK